MSKETKMTGIPIRLATLQSSVTMPGGLLVADVTLSKEKHKRVLGLEWRPEGLFVHLDTGDIGIIPHANVRMAIVDKTAIESQKQSQKALAS